MKSIIKKIVLVLLVFVMVLTSGCHNFGDDKKQEHPSVVNTSVSVSDEQLYFLQQYIAVIPPFQNIKDVDDNFWYNFIFNLYTHSTVNDGLTITDEDKNDWIIVEKDTISAVTKQLFGIELPNYYPHENDLYRDGTAFYVLLTSPKEEVDVLSTYKFVRNSNGEITFKNTKGANYCYYTLKKADSELGFIIVSLMNTGDSPAVNVKEEKTTKEKEVFSEEYTFEFESFAINFQ